MKILGLALAYCPANVLGTLDTGKVEIPMVKNSHIEGRHVQDGRDLERRAFPTHRVRNA
jgi:hypothetical protein